MKIYVYINICFKLSGAQQDRDPAGQTYTWLIDHNLAADSWSSCFRFLALMGLGLR